MITEIRLRDFKNFQDATLRLGPFSVVVGANASGKSNIRDALRFLHGIGRGYTIAEIIGGRYGAGGHLEWAPMRGAVKEIVRLGETAFSINVKMDLFSPSTQDHPHEVDYGISVENTSEGHDGFRVLSEFLTVDSKMVFETRHDVGALNTDDKRLIKPQFIFCAYDLKKEIPHDRSMLYQFASLLIQHHISQNSVEWTSFYADMAISLQAVDMISYVLGRVRFFDLIPELMRKPAFPGQIILGDSGENLPGALREICRQPDRKAILIDWLQELTPMDVVDFEFPQDAISGLVQLVMTERSGNKISAYSASDGTLRFLAMLAALLGKNPASLYFFEQIDNGIHPSRLKLLLDLIETQTAKTGIQVVTTTHSPELLTMIGDTTFENTSVVFRPPGSADAIIRRVADLPDAKRLRKKQGLGPLHASGWMEDVLAFASADEAAAAK